MKDSRNDLLCRGWMMEILFIIVIIIIIIIIISVLLTKFDPESESHRTESKTTSLKWKRYWI